VRRSFESRLQHLENALPPQPVQLQQTCPWEMLSIGQLERIVDGNDAKALSPNEVEQFIRTAFDRKAAGWTRTDVGRLNEIDKQVSWHLWHFILAIGRRHRQPNYDRFDAYDLAVGEVTRLAQLAATATTADEIQVLSSVIQKLRLDHQPMTLKEFEDLVLHGNLPERPAAATR
jgi:hypothetical protein